MWATKPSASWPHSPRRTSSSAWALLGMRSSPRHGLSPVSSSGLLAWWVIAIGRVCGTAIGTDPMPTTRVTPKRSTTSRTARAKRLPAVVGLGTVEQQVRRAAAVVQQPDDQARRVVGLVVVAHERHRGPPGAVVVELVDVEGRHHRPAVPAARSTRCWAARAAALPASRNPSSTRTIVSAAPRGVELGHVVDDVHEAGSLTGSSGGGGGRGANRVRDHDIPCRSTQDGASGRGWLPRGNLASAARHPTRHITRHPGEPVPRQLREVVFVDGVRTPLRQGQGPVRRDPRRRPRHQVHPRADAPQPVAAARAGRRGGRRRHHPDRRPGPDHRPHRRAALRLPQSVPGFAIDRMCAGAMTAVTTTASGIAFGCLRRRHRRRRRAHGPPPDGRGRRPQPADHVRAVVDPDALVMGKTAENLHDRYPTITKERVDAYAVRSQEKTAAAYDAGKIQPDLVPGRDPLGRARLGPGLDRRADAARHHAWSRSPRSRRRSARTAR